ncbi:hypothetical protein STCU_09464 [Strigomonas culicis]|nr:hypothetical protein STCU_09464 [Strigomonas culicis]|eukprot:EPY19431.1 hypothetical protein STCU_09464 [Strigomonas culicis]
MQMSKLELQGRLLGPKGALVVGTALMKNRYVTVLDLSHNNISDDGALSLAEMLKVNTLIQTLNLSQNNISDVGGIALASAFVPNVTPTGQPGQWNRTLFSIILTGNNLGDDSLLAFSNAAACHRDLTLVDLSWNHIGPLGTRCLMRCYQKNPLCNFVLAANAIGDEGVEYLCAALKQHGGKNQTTLNLYRNDISHRGAAAIGQLLADDDRVLEVNLAGNTLGLRGIRELKNAMTSAPNVVRSLLLNDNMIGDEGAKELVPLITADLPMLERLDLADNKITDVGACSIVQALMANTKIQLVNLQFNSLGSKAVAVLVDLVRQTKTIKSINVYGCVTAADLRRAITQVVGEADGVHVEVGADPDQGDEGNPLLMKLEEHLQMIADEEAQQRAKEEELKAKKKKKKKDSKTD